MERLRSGARIVAPLAACAVVVCASLPWTISGTATRNAFSTIRSARLLAIAGEGLPTTLLGLFFFVPALAAGSVLAAALRRPRVAGGLAALTGLAAVGLAAVVRSTSLGGGAGVVPAIVAGVVAALAGVVLVAIGAPRRR